METDVQGRTMAGALSENAPRPVSVVTVDGEIPTPVECPPETIPEIVQDDRTQNIRETTRCFTSTEAQTDNGPRSIEATEDLRDAPRRERRVRRHHRRAMRSCSMPPTYPGGPACVQAGTGVGNAPGMPLVPSVGGFLHPPPPHLGLRGLSLGLPFPVPASVSAFGRLALFRHSFSIQIDIIHFFFFYYQLICVFRNNVIGNN